MLHKERLSALEHQVPLPEIPLEEMALSESTPIISQRALAIALIGAGSGALPAFYLAPIAELHDIWPVGLIPLTLGLACAFGTWKTRS
jgi:hypothetical protein